MAFIVRLFMMSTVATCIGLVLEVLLTAFLAIAVGGSEAGLLFLHSEGWGWFSLISMHIVGWVIALHGMNEIYDSPNVEQCEGKVIRVTEGNYTMEARIYPR